MSSFIEQCQAAVAQPEDIDDFIDQWHGSPAGTSLHDFLGMTEYEYALWVSDAEILPMILKAHARNRSIDELLAEGKVSDLRK